MRTDYIYKAPLPTGARLRDYQAQKTRLNTKYYVKHESKDRPVLFKLEDYHDESLRRLYDGFYRQIIIKGRQVYFTTFCAVLMFDMCIFRPGFRASINNMTLMDMEKTIGDKIHYIAKNSPFVAPHIMKDGMTKTGVQFKNGSTIEVSRSGRSHTSNFNLLTESAYIAQTMSDKFEETYTGTMNGSQFGISFMETSPYGRENKFVSLTRTMKKREQNKLLRPGMDFAVLFVPWWKKPRNLVSMDNAKLTEIPTHFNEYFDGVEDEEGTSLNLQQRAWYMAKYEVDSLNDMHTQKSEHPSTLEEALAHNADIYITREQMERAETEGRVLSIPLNVQRPSVVTWDFGSGKSHTAFAVWQYNTDTGHNEVVYSYQHQKEPLSHFIQVLAGLNFNIAQHFLPHDAGYKNAVARALSRQDGDITIQTLFENAGIRNATVLTRVSNKKAGFDASLNFIGGVRFCSTRANAMIDSLRGVQRKLDDKNMEVLDTLRPHGKESDHNHLYDCFELAARAKEHNLLYGYLRKDNDTSMDDLYPNVGNPTFDGCYV